MKAIIFSNWNIIRFLRLGIGLVILVQAVMAADILFGLMGLLFTGMAVFNASCCDAGTCAAPPAKNDTGSKEISYEDLNKQP
ncbi:hypothetical protein [Daejeonella sp.]|uniref:hypothetical protein n=1 Tax=Daejeonella sp. TaxID=2805397 RepID=UPI0027234551|nr:hypothetical protein [Daejeonella sp.]MDO8994697.1 hypothetical protein [Daejeonella sp.]MDP2414458.1 hypothetical protein [Daejeonella sp.]